MNRQDEELADRHRRQAAAQKVYQRARDGKQPYTVDEVQRWYVEGWIPDEELDDAIEEAMSTPNQKTLDEKVGVFMDYGQTEPSRQNFVMEFIVVGTLLMAVTLFVVALVKGVPL